MRLGVQIEQDGTKNYVKIQSNDYEKIENALEEELGLDTGRYGYDVRERDRMKDTLQRLFETHSEFYNYFGFDSSTTHGGTGRSFNTDGWYTFLEDVFNKPRLYEIEDEEDLQQFCDVIAQKLADTLQAYEDSLDNDENFVAKSSVSVDVESSGRLKEPELLDDALVVGNEGVHKLQVQTVEDAETLEDIKNTVEDDTRDVYEQQVEAKTNALKSRINQLEDKIKNERQKMLVKGLEMVNDLEDWKVEDGHLKYTKTIHPETVQHRDKDDDPRELSEEAKEKFYVKGLKVEIRGKIKKPNADGNESYHPHVFDWGACSGNFREEMSKEGLEKVVKQLKHIDIHRDAQNDAERELMDNLEDYIKTDENGEEVQQELWDAQDR